jgi:hypothetical protein
MAETLILEVDHTARAAYVRFSAGSIVRTVEMANRSTST